jgi:hypothetical protein
MKNRIIANRPDTNARKGVTGLVLFGLLLAAVILPAPAAAVGNCAVFRSWSTGDTVTAGDLNSSFTQAATTNGTPPCVDDYSTDVAQMRLNTSPGGVGSESLATSLAGELERLRYVFKNVFGWAQWYSLADLDLGAKNVTTTGSISAASFSSSGGAVTVANGGTGRTTLTTGTYLKGNSTSPVTLQAVPIPVADGGTGATTLTSGAYLKGNGTGAVAFQAAPVPVADGGSGATTLTLNGVLFGNGTSAVQATGQGGSNTVLTANAGAPAFSATPTVTSLTTTGATTAGSLTVGGGASVTKILSATASLDFGATPAHECEDQTLTVTGAVDGNVVMVGVPNALATVAHSSFTAYVSAADTVKVRRCNSSASPLSDPGGTTIRATVIQH